MGLFFHHVKPFHKPITVTHFTIDYSAVHRVNFVLKILKSLDQNVRKYILICIYIYYVIINQFRYGRRDYSIFSCVIMCFYVCLCVIIEPWRHIDSIVIYSIHVRPATQAGVVYELWSIILYIAGGMVVVDTSTLHDHCRAGVWYYNPWSPCHALNVRAGS